MLVLAREVGMSLYVESAGDESVVTVLKLHQHRKSIWISIARYGDEPATEPVELTMDAPISLGNYVELSLHDLRDTRVRLGITAPREALIHRLEVYEAIQRENRAAAAGHRDDDDGPAGAPVPRPPNPRPPSLSVRLTEPLPDDGRDGQP